MARYDDLTRDEIADLLAQRQKMGPMDYGVAGAAAALPANMPTQMPAGMPQTPQGGVPGSGLATAGTSVLGAPPPQARGGGMPSMGLMQQLRGGGQMSDMEAAKATQALPVTQGAGQGAPPVAPQLGALGALSGGSGGTGIMSMLPKGMQGGFMSMLPGMQGSGQISDKEYSMLKDRLEADRASRALRGSKRRGY